MTNRCWEIREYQVIDSTNLEARRLIARGYGAGLVVTARHQTAGRGRMGRGWLDRPGKSLLVSVVLEGMDGFRASAVAALSARAAVRRLGGSGPLCKWPNDLVYGNRKAGGLLSEAVEAESGRLIVVGLGLNVAYLPGELEISGKLKPTSLLIEEGRTFSIRELLDTVLEEMERRLEGGSAGWMEEYRVNLAYRGEEVLVTGYALYGVIGTGEGGAREPETPRGPLRGTLEGVDDEGHLLLRVDRETLVLAAGDLEPLSTSSGGCGVRG